jgi:hypothetical protein
MFGGGIPVTMGFVDLCHGLILLFAFSVFEKTLQQLRDEGAFKCKSNQLGPLMKESSAVLKWLDFSTVDKARDSRNTIAHERKTLARRDVWRYIDAIEAELVGWKILSGPVTADYAISVSTSKRNDPPNAESK